MKHVLLTGATGFIGRELSREIVSRGWRLRAAVRSRNHESLPVGTEASFIKSIGPATDWSDSLSGIHTVVHLAARVHIMKDTAADPITEFRLTNVAGTERLARCAAVCGVKRFIFMSTVKVNGEGRNKPYTEWDLPLPVDPYAVSKWEAEKVLSEIAGVSGMEVVILRPPLVYGPGVKANFLNLLKLIHLGIPLPFGGIDNLRSFIYLGNLVDSIINCITNPKAAGRTYLVGDRESISTPELISRLGKALRKPAKLFTVPHSFMNIAGTLTGKKATFNRLIDSLIVDSSRITSDLGWIPPFTMEEGLKATAEWYIRIKQPQ